MASPPPLRNPFVFQQLRSPPVALIFPAHRAREGDVKSLPLKKFCILCRTFIARLTARSKIR